MVIMPRHCRHKKWKLVGQATNVAIGVIESSARLMNNSLRPVIGSLSGDRRRALNLDPAQA
jgi:hypothetical protein